MTKLFKKETGTNTKYNKLKKNQTSAIDKYKYQESGYF